VALRRARRTKVVRVRIALVSEYKNGSFWEQAERLNPA
jgi:hypothetical protein